MALDPRVQDALRLERLALPAEPRIVTIDAEEYVDWTGNDALRITVILDEATTDEMLAGDNIIQLKGAIHDSLLSHGIRLFPYTFLMTETERQAVMSED